MCDSATDVLLLLAGVHVLTCAHRGFWLLTLLIPGRAGHWLWVNAVGPYLLGGGAHTGGGQDAKDGGRKARRGERDAKQKNLKGQRR